MLAEQCQNGDDTTHDHQNMLKKRSAMIDGLIAFAF